MSEPSATTLSLRRTWSHASSGLPQGSDRVSQILDHGVNSAEAEGDLTEARLLTVVESARAAAEQVLEPRTAAEFTLKLRRGVYEYLLAVDAAGVQERTAVPGPPPSQQPRPDTGATLIGVEEVAELENRKPEPQLPQAASAPPVPLPAGPEQTSPPPHPIEDQTPAPAPESNGRHTPETATSPELTEIGEVAGSETEVKAPSGHRRFGMFHRRQPDSEQTTQTPAEPVSSSSGTHNLSVSSSDGFHIGHPSDLVNQALPEAAPAPSQTPPPVVPQAPKVPPPPPLEMVADLGDADIDDQTAGLETAEDGEPRSETDISEARRNVEERLRRKRCDDAASLLQQLAQEVGGRAVAELAVDAGDRCRALGKRKAATNCYLAAARSDPVYAVPLARLADICIDDQDVDLAVSYLERIARLSRLRGDIKAALRVYRKIATVAPYREDILELLLRAQTTGKLDP